MNIAGYLEEIRALHKRNDTTEHSFRPALARLFESIDPTLTVINEPKRLVDVGAPDFVFSRNNISIGWCEAKDIGKDIRKFATGDYSKEQKGRYTKGLPNLIYTNGLDFEFIRDGKSAEFVTIADLIPTMPTRPDQFAVLERLLRDFASQTPVSIRSAKQLAGMMAGKAALIKDIMGRALVADIEGGSSTELTDQYEGFKSALIHDISVAEFADIYSETLAYGLFAARLHDTTHDTFSRTEALELLPKSNPFLRNLFVYIAGPNLDDRLSGRIDELCQIFLATDLHDLLKDFGKFTARNDPFLHFYETFLAEYNPAKRKARGVWYTPEPVVNFIVRAVDDVLKTEFGLADGLADTSKVSIDWDTGQNDAKGKPIIQKKDVHRVQILDPATGTGTFLAEVIKLVAGRVKGVAPGQWSSYVEQDLIPRLHGFELLMASYAMCHMKLDMMLTEMGYKPSASPPRLGVYLTNSLEEGERVEQTLPFARWVSEEAKGANTIKRDQPIMCVIGNPPYSVSSPNKGAWISSLVDEYKADLDESSINALSDDYVKFLRLSEYFVSRNKSGIVGMITNNSFVDGVVHRKMRLHFRKTFDKIHVINLHGDSNKKEKSPSGEADKNVFDIRQGVSIILATKNGNAGGLADVLIQDIFGSRQSKYEWLWQQKIHSKEFESANFQAEYHFFTNRPFCGGEEYKSGVKVSDLFVNGLSGIKFRKDKLLIVPNYTRADAEKMASDVVSLPEASLTAKYGISETKDWKIKDQRSNFADPAAKDFIRVAYRPLDFRHSFYPVNLINKIIPRGDSRRGLMRNMIDGPNLALVAGRQNKSGDVNHFLVVDCPSEMKTGESTIQSYHFPLYLYPEEGTLDQTIRLNFDPKLYAQIREAADLTGPLTPPDGTDVFRTATGAARPDEVKVFDYIYGVLHSPAYRETYREFLKIDFPRVPFPRDPATFAHVSAQGEALRRLHLMEPVAIGETPFPFEGEGDSLVEKPRFEQGKVWINAAQHFTGVSETAWNFHIGGYQPAQKWLKDRKGRTLSWDDIRHYQRIIKILDETDRIMREIELPLD